MNDTNDVMSWLQDLADSIETIGNGDAYKEVDDMNSLNQQLHELAAKYATQLREDGRNELEVFNIITNTVASAIEDEDCDWDSEELIQQATNQITR